jgi:hypothetical protein
LNQYVVSLKDNPWLNKYCLKEILKQQSAISVPAAGFVAIGAKLTVFIVVLNQELKKTLNTDDVVGGGATTAAQISTIALGSTLKNLQQIHDLTRSAGHLDGGNIVNGGSDC